MTFQTGKSGNLSGRPKGTGSRQQAFNAFVEPHKEQLFKKAIELALNGNEAMLRLFLDRMLPAKPTAEPINIQLPREISKATSLTPMAIEVFKALERQELTPEQFKILITALREHRENILAIELSKKIYDLELDAGIKTKPNLLMKMLEPQSS